MSYHLKNNKPKALHFITNTHLRPREYFRNFHNSMMEGLGVNKETPAHKALMGVMLTNNYIKWLSLVDSKTLANGEDVDGNNSKLKAKEQAEALEMQPRLWAMLKDWNSTQGENDENINDLTAIKSLVNLFNEAKT